MERFDLTEWQPQSTESLIEYITHHFHESLRENMPRILALFEKVANRHGDASPELREALPLYQEFVQKMPLHLLKEEQILFPLLVAHIKDQGPTPITQLATPILAMESEHDEDLEILRRIQELTKDFTPPDHACGSYRLLLESLKTLSLEFQLHVAIENEILFKRFQVNTES